MRLPTIERQVPLPGPAGQQAIAEGEGVVGEAIGAAGGQVLENLSQVNRAFAEAEFTRTMLDFRKKLAEFYEEHIYGNPNPETYQDLFEEFVQNGIYEETFSNIRNGSAQRMFEERGSVLLEESRSALAQRQIQAQSEIADNEFRTSVQELISAGDYEEARTTMERAVSLGVWGNAQRRQWNVVIDKAKAKGEFWDLVIDGTYEAAKDEGMSLDQAVERARDVLNQDYEPTTVMTTENGDAVTIPLFNDADRDEIRQVLEAKYSTDLREEHRAQNIAVSEFEQAAIGYLTNGTWTPDFTIWAVTNGPHGQVLRDYVEPGTPAAARILSLARALKANEEASGSGNEEWLKASNRVLIERFRRYMMQNIENNPHQVWAFYEELVDPVAKDEYGNIIVSESGQPVMKRPGDYIDTSVTDMTSVLNDILQHSTDRLRQVVDNEIDQAFNEGYFGDHTEFAGADRYNPALEAEIQSTLYQYIDEFRGNLDPATLREKARQYIEARKMPGQDPVSVFLQEQQQIVVGERGLASGLRFQSEIEKAQEQLQAGDLEIPIKAGDPNTIRAVQQLWLMHAEVISEALGISPDTMGAVLRQNTVTDYGERFFLIGDYYFTVRYTQDGLKKDERIYRTPVERVPELDEDGKEVKDEQGRTILHALMPTSFNEENWTDITDELRVSSGGFTSGTAFFGSGQQRVPLVDAIRDAWFRTNR